MAEPSPAKSGPVIAAQFTPGSFADQLASLHAIGASAIVEIDMPGDTAGTIRMHGGHVRQARWKDRVGMGALTAMAVYGGGGLRMNPAPEDVEDSLRVLTPALINLMRDAEKIFREAQQGITDLPRPDEVGGQDGVLAHAHVRQRKQDDSPDLNIELNENDASSFPEDWLGELVPQGMRGQEPAKGDTEGSLTAVDWQPPPVGSMLGRCYLGAEIGRGATAVVYRALHITLKIDVAVKVFVPDDEGQLTLPLDEARLLARLNHPNVLRVLDCNDERPYPHLICEYVDGTTLGELIQRSGSLDAVQAIRMIRQAAEGLAYAAAQGVVHCDVKPGNLLVTRNGGVVKIVDLGLARVLAGSGNGPSNVISGTPAYISPEQVLQQLVTPASDIYSLGCTMWHALVGKPPFIDADPVRMMVMHVQERPEPLSEAIPRVDARLERLMARMLDKDAAQRPSYPELIEELQTIIERIERGTSNSIDVLGARIFLTLRLAVGSIRKALGQKQGGNTPER